MTIYRVLVHRVSKNPVTYVRSPIDVRGLAYTTGGTKCPARTRAGCPSKRQSVDARALCSGCDQSRGWARGRAHVFCHQNGERVDAVARLDGCGKRPRANTHRLSNGGVGTRRPSSAIVLGQRGRQPPSSSVILIIMLPRARYRRPSPPPLTIMVGDMCPNQVLARTRERFTG